MKTPSAVPERILVTGYAGSGKTECYVKTAAYYREHEVPGKFRVVNTDIPGTVERCNERWPDWTSNVEFIDTRDWESFAAATELYRQMSEPRDWLVIDSIDRAWVWIRDEFLRLKAAASGKKLDPTDIFGSLSIEITGGEYGDKVNPAYDRWMFPLLDHTRCPAHIIACSPSQPLVVEGMYADDKSLIQEFKEFGLRPSGQKLNHFRFQTTLLAAQERGVYTLSTAGKDRSRERMDKVTITDTLSFPLVYLQGVAGWVD